MKESVWTLSIQPPKIGSEFLSRRQFSTFDFQARGWTCFCLRAEKRRDAFGVLHGLSPKISTKGVCKSFPDGRGAQ